MPDDLFTVSSGYYRPQQSWAKVIFSQASVCPQGGCLPQCMLGYTPPRPGRHSPTPRNRQTPRTRHTPPGPGRPPRPGTPPGSRPPQTRQTPPRSRLQPGGVCLSACWDIPPWTRQTPPHPHPRNRQTPRTRQTPPGSRLQHTVNERPVSILLECILVIIIHQLHHIQLLLPKVHCHKS